MRSLDPGEGGRNPIKAIGRGNDRGSGWLTSRGWRDVTVNGQPAFGLHPRRAAGSGRRASRGGVTSLGDRMAAPRSGQQRRGGFCRATGGPTCRAGRASAEERRRAEDGCRRAPGAAWSGPPLARPMTARKPRVIPAVETARTRTIGAANAVCGGLARKCRTGRTNGKGHRRSPPRGPETAENEARVWLDGVRASKVPREKQPKLALS